MGALDKMDLPSLPAARSAAVGPPLGIGDSSSSSTKKIRRDMRRLASTGVAFTPANPVKVAIRSGKIHAKSKPADIKSILHAGPVLHAGGYTLEAEYRAERAIVDPSGEGSPELQSPNTSAKRKKVQPRSKSRKRAKKKSRSTYRVLNWNPTKESQTLTQKMRKRRRQLREERKEKLSGQLSLHSLEGGSRSFSSIWTIHALLGGAAASSSYESLGFQGESRASSTQDQSDSRTLPSAPNQIPSEFMVMEKMLQLHKQQAWQDCRESRNAIRDEMDVSLMMLPAEFLFKHKFARYAQERSFDNIARVMKRLVSNAKASAWQIWLKFVRQHRLIETRDRMSKFKKARGEELLGQIGARICLSTMFRGFATWRRNIRSMRRAELNAAATEIQRIVRGALIARPRVEGLRFRVNKFMAQLLFVEWCERRWRIRRAEEVHEFRRQVRATEVIASAMRRIVARRKLEAKREAKKRADALARMEVDMALRVQCAWRMRQGRFSLFLRRRARQQLNEEREYASRDIQRVFRGWKGREHARETRRSQDADRIASRALKRLLNQRVASAFRAWESYSSRQLAVKRMMKRAMAGLMGRCFIMWSENVAEILLQQSEDRKRRREEERRRRLAEEERKRQEEVRLENERKARKALMKMLMKALAKCFQNWAMYTDQMRNMKALMRRVMGGKLRSRFIQWHDFVEDVKAEREEMGRLAWEAEQRRLAEIAAKEAAEEEERMRKLKWALKRFTDKILVTCFDALKIHAYQSKQVRIRLRKTLQGRKRRLWDRWWQAVLESRENSKTGSMFLRRLMNKRVYSCFAKWTEVVAQARRVRAKFARALSGRKRYYFISWQEGMLSRIAVRSLTSLLAAQKSSGGRGLVGLTRAMNSVIQQIMLQDIEEMTHEDVMMLRRASLRVRDWHKIENAAALRVQSRWRCRKGMLAYQLLQAGRREKRDRELRAVMMLTRVVRGRIGRKRTAELRKQRAKEKAQEQYLRERRAAEERERWLRESEETSFREALLKKRAMELELEQAKLQREMAKARAEEAGFRKKQLEVEEEERDAKRKKERDSLVDAFGGWVECTDISSGAPYYHNEITGVTQWERPEEMGGPLGGDGSGVGAWIKIPGGPDPSDPKKQLHYFYNTVTGQSSWDDPRLAQMRAPKKEDRRRCQHASVCVKKAQKGKNAAKGGKRKEKNAEPAIAVRECIRCRLDFCLDCFVEVHKSKKKRDHRFKTIVEKIVQSLDCRDCTAMAARWCKVCDANFCDNCFAWAHQGGSLALHECQMFVPGSQVCAECCQRVAVKSCDQCGDCFCDNCYGITHRSGTKKRHTFKPIEVVKETLRDGEEYCSVCTVRVADRACDPCGDPFCKRCFEETHKSENKRNHNWTPWSKLKTGRDWVEINDAVSGQVLYFNVKTRKTQTNKPTGLMSGMERDIEKKRKLAEKEMSARMDKERELIRLRAEASSLEKQVHIQKQQIEEQGKVQLPQRRSFFGEVLKSPSKLAKARVLKWEIQDENKRKEKEFLRSRLITKERDEEIEKEAETFGTDGHADRVVDKLVNKLGL